MLFPLKYVTAITDTAVTWCCFLIIKFFVDDSICFAREFQTRIPFCCTKGTATWPTGVFIFFTPFYTEQIFPTFVFLFLTKFTCIVPVIEVQLMKTAKPFAFCLSASPRTLKISFHRHVLLKLLGT